MKTSEVEMAQFLEGLKAPQSRRIVECLRDKPLTKNELIKKSKLSERSIELHLEPLSKSKLVLQKVEGQSTRLHLNKKRFKKYSDWFVQFQD
jgi:DNA-binding transcriptional ArsR family regulator